MSFSKDKEFHGSINLLELQPVIYQTENTFYVHLYDLLYDKTQIYCAINRLIPHSRILRADPLHSIKNDPHLHKVSQGIESRWNSLLTFL